MLDYDNSAFYYFMITMLAIYLIPAYIMTIRYVLKAFLPETDKRNVARTELEKKKLQKLKVTDRGFKKLNSTWFFINIGVIVLFTAIMTFLIVLCSQDSDLARFDPYKILDIDIGSTDKQIKRAYKIKALEYHPDKNIGDKKAEQMFMNVAKAYEALTDEEAKANYEQFGNPDGKQSLEVSIGLPTFLLDKDNHNVILIVYLICLVVIIPTIVACWYSNSKKYGENNVMYATYGFFARHGLNENSSLKMMPEVLAGANENLEKNNFKDRETFEMVKKMLAVFRGKSLDGFMAKPRFDKTSAALIINKGNVILHSHLGRNTLANQRPPIALPEEWQKDLDFMLAGCPNLITAMVDICVSNRWLQTCLNVMQFSQHLTQGLWIKDPKHLQLPHVTREEVKHMMKGKGEFKDYLKVADEEKKGLSTLGDKERADVYEVAKIIPDLQVDLKHFVEDEEEIAEKDTVTLQVTLTRLNLEDGTRASPVHAPFFPVKKDESWWVVLTEVEHKHLITVEKITDLNKKVVHEIKFMAPPRTGTYKFLVYIVSDSYLGLDQQIPFEMKVIGAHELPEFEAHKDDLELDNEASLFEQVLTANQDSDESSDEEEDDEVMVPTKPADDSAAGLSEAEKKKRQKRLAGKKAAVEDEDETSDEDEEGDLVADKEEAELVD
mmetsp:Transcript_16122/g.37579  ORF Transcript_16122/g.37579 Transcript_16122/m.37579 type:complete len:665 (-) Transcript_16122:220-2214(-)